MKQIITHNTVCNPAGEIRAGFLCCPWNPVPTRSRGQGALGCCVELAACRSEADAKAVRTRLDSPERRAPHWIFSEAWRRGKQAGGHMPALETRSRLADDKVQQWGGLGNKSIVRSHAGRKGRQYSLACVPGRVCRFDPDLSCLAGLAPGPCFAEYLQTETKALSVGLMTAGAAYTVVTVGPDHSHKPGP